MLARRSVRPLAAALTLTALLGLLAPQRARAQGGCAAACAPSALRLVGTPNWINAKTREMRCDIRAATAARKASSSAATDAMRDVVAGGDDWLGRYWDMRTWTRPADGAVFYPYIFSKTLQHDNATGLARAADVATLLAAVQCPSQPAIEAIAQSASSARKMEGINGCDLLLLMGGEQLSHRMPFHYVHPIDSLEHAFEMAEVYAMQLLRDVPFADYERDPTVAKVVAELNKFPFTTTAPTIDGLITTKTLLRGGAPGTTLGPYVSQLLIHPFWYATLRVEQRFHVERDGDNALTLDGWLDVQNGVTEGDGIDLPDPETFYAFSPRVLASNVHHDPLFNSYYNAAMIAVQNGIPTTGIDSTKSTAWSTAGDIDLFAAVGHGALNGIRTAWRQKWRSTMRIRPEVMAARIELARARPELSRGLNEIPGLRAIMGNMLLVSDLLELVKADNKRRTAALDGGDGVESLFLAMLYREGSPTHPSLPAGHATVGGACSTILKAMLNTFDGDDPTKPTKWLAPGRAALHASRDGARLVEYADADAGAMTVNGELNKLAANLALGRNWAGVHYRADGDGGMVLGEAYAIAYLVDKAREYRDDVGGLFGGWLLEKLDGSVVRITAAGVEELLPPAGAPRSTPHAPPPSSGASTPSPPPPSPPPPSPPPPSPPPRAQLLLVQLQSADAAPAG